MDLFSAMEIASSGLNAQRVRMNALSSNVANARTTRTAEGGPYRRLDPVFQAVALDTGNSTNPSTTSQPSDKDRGAYLVSVAEIRQDQAPPQKMYDPNHPDADEQGFVELPNVNVVEEMVNLITATRAYESGVTVMQSIKSMVNSALRIGG